MPSSDIECTMTPRGDEEFNSWAYEWMFELASEVPGFARFDHIQLKAYPHISIDCVAEISTIDLKKTTGLCLSPQYRFEDTERNLRVDLPRSTMNHNRKTNLIRWMSILHDHDYSEDQLLDIADELSHFVGLGSPGRYDVLEAVRNLFDET